MKTLDIAKTKVTPGVRFESEKAILWIDGESYPENAVEFYRPIMEWVEDCLGEGQELTVDFRLHYFNTSSSKALLDLLDILDSGYKNGCRTRIRWCYEEDDEDLLESGEDLAEDLEIPFEFYTCGDTCC